MNEVVADAVQQSQVEQLPIVRIAVGMMEFDLVLHREVQSAVRAPSALVLEELPSDCIQSDVLASSCAPVAPIAIIRAHSFAQRCLVFHSGLPMPLQGVGVPREPCVLALAHGGAVFVYDPVGAFMGVFAFGPAIKLLPQQVV